MINEQAIFNALNYNSNGDKRIKPLRAALMKFLVNEKGYSRVHIAKAIGVSAQRVKRWDYVKDKYENTDIYKDAIKSLRESAVELVPHYENVIANFKEIKIDLCINDVKFVKKNKRWNQ